jgi:hypothetical protein
MVRKLRQYSLGRSLKSIFVAYSRSKHNDLPPRHWGVPKDHASLS